MRRRFRWAYVSVLLAASLACAAPPRTFPYPRPLPEPTAAQLPRWRGFNLLYKFNAMAKPTPDAVMVEDFRLIASLGFNFVRLPLDYRGWIIGGDWEQLDEAKLKEIDRIVALGGEYGVHVSLNFHRAPGYTVAKPAETRSVWTDADARRVCAQHWAAFARRYRGISNARLSFNLFNEPAGVSEAAYFSVVEHLATAIRAKDPGRLILCDGLDYGAVPPRSLRPLGVALSTRGYQPMNLSHYRASWIAGAERWAAPAWPMPQVSAFLYAPGKPQFHSPLVLDGPLGGKTLRLRVHAVSTRARLRAVDQQGTVLWEHAFQPGPGAGEWQTSTFRPEYKSYHAVYDRDYRITLPAHVTRVEVRAVEGDWLTLAEISVESADRHWTLRPVETWGLKQTGTVRFDPSDAIQPLRAPAQLDRAWLRDTVYAPWRRVADEGVGVMIGEFGAYQFTPHAVVLRWMEDVLTIASEAGWGWALWEFRGGFGVLDSKRSDVAYETWAGHQLDRALLELLQRM